MKKKQKPRKSGLRLLWVTDPWDTLDHPKDTTLRLAEEAIRRGARCYLAENRSISLVGGRAHVQASEIVSIRAPRTKNEIERTPTKQRPVADFDHLFYRADPPVDLAYLLPLQMLTLGQRGKTEKKYPKIHSSVESLFFLNEKWAPAFLGKFFPKSLVSASSAELAAFALRESKTVLKPLYCAQSKGVKTIEAMAYEEGGASRATQSLAALFHEATEGGKIPVILQEYLPGIADGEIRLWFAGAKLIAAVKKIPKTGETIIDMDRGGTLAPAKLGIREREAVRLITRLLKKQKILFAAVDVIDGKITDFNHTSPGLLVPMEELLGENLAKKALAPILR
jgi:glutathione synthase